MFRPQKLFNQLHLKSSDNLLQNLYLYCYTSIHKQL